MSRGGGDGRPSVAEVRACPEAFSKGFLRGRDAARAYEPNPNARTGLEKARRDAFGSGA